MAKSGLKSEIISFYQSKTVGVNNIYSGSFMPKNPNISPKMIYTPSHDIHFFKFGDSQVRVHTNPSVIYLYAAEGQKYTKAKDLSIGNKIKRLEDQFNSLVSSTWNYIFDKKQHVEMSELSKGILDDVKKMQELLEKFQESDDQK